MVTIQGGNHVIDWFVESAIVLYCGLLGGWHGWLVPGDNLSIFADGIGIGEIYLLVRLDINGFMLFKGRFTDLHVEVEHVFLVINWSKVYNPWFKFLPFAKTNKTKRWPKLFDIKINWIVYMVNKRSSHSLWGQLVSEVVIDESCELEHNKNWYCAQKTVYGVLENRWYKGFERESGLEVDADDYACDKPES